MPGFNGTGPYGAGPGTGWGRGPCGAEMGWQRGRGWGRGPFGPPTTKKEEAEFLNDEAEALEEELKAVRQRLSDLKAKK